MNQSLNEVYQATNREKRFVTKKGKYWCPRCDAAKVGNGEKCAHCGKKPLCPTLKHYHHP